MDDINHTWMILHRTDWGHACDSLLPENAPVPEGDEQFRVIEVMPVQVVVDLLRGVLSGRIIRDETEGGEPILLDLSTDPATVVRFDHLGVKTT